MNEKLKLDFIICPWCGDKYHHDDILYRRDEDTVSCRDGCGKRFHVKMVEYYEIRKVEDETKEN